MVYVNIVEVADEGKCSVADSHANVANGSGSEVQIGAKTPRLKLNMNRFAML